MSSIQVDHNLSSWIIDLHCFLIWTGRCLLVVPARWIKRRELTWGLRAIRHAWKDSEGVPDPAKTISDCDKHELIATSSPSRNVICRCEYILTLKGATCSLVVGESISILEQFGCRSLSQLCQAGVSTDAVIVKSVTVEESGTPFCFIRLNQQSIFSCWKNWIEGLVDKFALIVMMRE